MPPLTGIFFDTVAPAIGCLLANLMFLAPLPAVLKVRHRNELGPLNPLPFPLICVNCGLWLLYGAVTSDWFVFAASVRGCGGRDGVRASVSAAGLAPDRRPNPAPMGARPNLSFFPSRPTLLDSSWAPSTR